MRECCETKRESGARTEGCVTKIEEVDDALCEELEEWESMKERKSSERGRSCASTIQSSTSKNKTNTNDASSVSQLVQTVHHGKKARRGLQNAQSE